MRKQKAEIEALTKSDPELAMEKLKELDDIRIQERMSLRHRKSKWAHLQGLRAMHDKSVSFYELSFIVNPFIFHLTTQLIYKTFLLESANLLLPINVIIYFSEYGSNRRK